MIGDDANDDVQGAMDAGMRAILVRTGKYRDGDEDRCRITTTTTTSSSFSSSTSTSTTTNNKQLLTATNTTTNNDNANVLSNAPLIVRCRTPPLAVVDDIGGAVAFLDHIII